MERIEKFAPWHHTYYQVNVTMVKKFKFTKRGHAVRNPMMYTPVMRMHKPLLPVPASG